LPSGKRLNVGIEGISKAGMHRISSALLGFALGLAAAAGLGGEAAVQFDIKAQPLAAALMAFGSQSGVIVAAPSALTRGRISTAVAGTLSLSDALTRMLEGTGLQFSKSDNGTFVIQSEVVHGL
jgi:hemoglobin/transferrin/lactoferrin receptor protein